MDEEIKLTPEEREANIKYIINGLILLGYPLDDNVKIESLFNAALGKSNIDFSADTV